MVLNASVLLSTVTIESESFSFSAFKNLFLNSYAAPGANMQIFPPNNGGERGKGYQTLESPPGMVINFQ